MTAKHCWLRWPDLLADEVEGVDVSGSAQQAFVEDDDKHQPGAGQEQEAHGQQEQRRVHHLQRRHKRLKVLANARKSQTLLRIGQNNTIQHSKKN